MFNVNRVTLLGNTTHDPETRATKSGTTVLSIGFATNSRVKDGEGNYVSEPEFHNLVCFGKLADFSEKRIKKGAPLYVEGKLHTSRYKTKEGKNASKTEVILDRLVLLSANKKGAVEAAEEA